MHPTFRALAIALALAPLTSAFAGPLRDDLLTLLGGYEDLPTAEQLRGLGEGVEAELMAIADDHAVPSSRRSRAVSSLQYFPSKSSRTFLEAHLDAADKGILRRKAALALGAGFGSEAVPKLTAVLADDDVLVRVAVAQALGFVGGDEAKAALTSRLANEADATVREAIAKALEGK